MNSPHQVIFECRIAGVQHSGADISKAKIGDNLFLIPEPDNPYDPDAIKVVHDNVCIGYVPRNKTHIVRAMLQDPIALTILLAAIDKRWGIFTIAVSPANANRARALVIGAKAADAIEADQIPPEYHDSAE